MLLREWTTDTPTPHIVRIEARRFANEITISVDGVVVHCRVAPFGLSAPFCHELLIDGASWTALAGMGFWGYGCEFVRTREAQQAIRRWRRNDALVRMSFASLLVFLAFSRLPAAISSGLLLKERYETLPSRVLLAIGLFGVALHLFRWYVAACRTQESSATNPLPRAADAESSSRSVFRCLGLVAFSVALSIGSFNAKSIALYFVGNREMVPVLTAILAGLAAIVLCVAFTIAVNPLSNAAPRDKSRGRAALLRRETTLGSRPRSASFFRPLLEDIRSTARRWKLGLPRFWIGRLRTNR